MKIIYVSSEEDQLNKLGELLKAYSKSAIENSNVFRIGLSGKLISLNYVFVKKIKSIIKKFFIFT